MIPKLDLLEKLFYTNRSLKYIIYILVNERFISFLGQEEVTVMLKSC